MPDKYGSRVLTPTEQRLVDHLAKGLTNKEVAVQLGTTEYVVKNYVRAVLDKLGLDSRTQVALWYEARKAEETLPWEPFQQR